VLVCGLDQLNQARDEADSLNAFLEARIPFASFDQEIIVRVDEQEGRGGFWVAHFTETIVVYLTSQETAIALK
jgi:hypothetical protein